jgi:phage/plasmid primase-like uncharacterized protein
VKLLVNALQTTCSIKSETAMKKIVIALTMTNCSMMIQKTMKKFPRTSILIFSN